MYKEKIVNVVTGEEIWRDYSDEEILEIENARKEFAIAANERNEKEIARLAILEKLGITEEEAKLLLS